MWAQYNTYSPNEQFMFISVVIRLFEHRGFWFPAPGYGYSVMGAVAIQTVVNLGVVEREEAGVNTVLSWGTLFLWQYLYPLTVHF